MPKKTTHYVPYRIACQIVQEAGIKHRAHFWRWHEEHKTNYIPKMPHRVYEEWTSWNDFLGNDNTFDKTRSLRRAKEYENKFRTYWDAVRWVQPYAKENNISNSREWYEHYDATDTIPKDIPKWPDVHYKEDGFSWKIFLGTNLESKIQNAQSTIGVIALHHVQHEQPNVFRLRVWKDGYYSMLDNLKNTDLDPPNPKCMWVLEENAVDFAVKVLDNLASRNGDNYIIPNINAVIWELMDLQIYRFIR